MPKHELNKEQEQPVVQQRTSNNDDKPVQRAEREAVSPFGGKSFWAESNLNPIQGKGGIGFPAIPVFANKEPIQQKAKSNNTGLPDNLKSGIENLSGHSMDDVKVHYNSDKPAQLQAHAYAQGSDIHLGAGQEKHLAHEAWHVVQQKENRVKPTIQAKGNININDDKGLEREADVMGAKALQGLGGNSMEQPRQLMMNNAQQIFQRVENEPKSISLKEAKKIILKSTKGLGTNEANIYDAIRRCGSRKSLINDTTVINALKGDMRGHELWKCYLLMEYGKESNYSSAIKQLWTATKGCGTDEDAVFSALNSMDKRAKDSFGLKYILHWELSGDDLEKALDLITTSDSIKGNLYGSGKTGEEKLIINESNLRELIDSRFAGASSIKLKTAMEILYQNPEGAVLNKALTSIESIRGLKTGDGLKQYKKAIEKRTAGINYYKKHKEDKGQEYDDVVDNPSPALSSKNENFTASSAQLRFGKVVGDSFGIDAVFGSLISPTGGMAGAGNSRIPLLKDGGAVATHGAVHDAAGYLYNSHGIGVGYDYLQSERNSQAGNPLAGQTNIDWWINEFDKTNNDVQWVERIINNLAFLGATVSKDYNIKAAFAKDYGKLNISEKRNTLKIMSENSKFLLWMIGIDNDDREAGVRRLMDSSNDDEKMELANYFYNNNGFNTISRVYKIIKPYVSEEVYNDYQNRTNN